MQLTHKAFFGRPCCFWALGNGLIAQVIALSTCDTRGGHATDEDDGTCPTSLRFSHGVASKTHIGPRSHPLFG